MFSFIWRRDAYVTSSVLFFSLLAIVYGIATCMIEPSNAAANSKVELAETYIEKADIYPQSSKPLYHVSEKMMISAISIEPYVSENWYILSNVLFSAGKTEAAARAKKISILLNNKVDNIAAMQLSSVSNFSPID